jgi:hypothetical protein
MPFSGVALIIFTDTLEPVQNLTRLKVLRTHNNLIAGTLTRLANH